MINYDAQLDLIADSYHLFPSFKVLHNYSRSCRKTFIREIKLLTSRFSMSKSLYIGTTEGLFDFFCENESIDILAQPWFDTNDCNSFTIEDLKQATQDYEVIYIGSCSIKRRTIEMMLISLNRDFIDLYDYFAMHNYYLTNFPDGSSIRGLRNHLVWHMRKVLSHLPGLDKSASLTTFLSDLSKRNNPREYMENSDSVYVFRHLLSTASEEKVAAFYSQKIACSLFQIRDFEELCSFLNSENCSDFGSFQTKEFLAALNELLDHMKETLRNRSHHDILLQWVDCTSYDDFNVKYNDHYVWKELHDLMTKGYSFEHFYSGVPNTKPVFKEILSGSNYIDDNLIYMDSFEKSRLITQLTECGYDFSYISLYFPLFDMNRRITKYSSYSFSYLPASLVQWLALSKLASSDQPCCILCHNVYETHAPYYSTNMKTPFFQNDETYDNISKDVQFERYSCVDKMISNTIKWTNPRNVTSIIMSDHGRTDKKRVMWKECRSRGFCFLYGAGIPTGINTGFIQPDLIHKVIEQITTSTYHFDELGREYAWLQGEDHYNKKRCSQWIAKYQNHQLDEDDYLTFMQYRGIVTAQYKYIRYPIRELLIAMPDETLIETESVESSILNRLSSLSGTATIDISKSSHYSHTRKLYQLLGYINEKGEWNE